MALLQLACSHLMISLYLHLRPTPKYWTTERADKDTPHKVKPSPNHPQLWTSLELPLCHIHKITLSSTLDLHSCIHQLQSTFAQLAVRTLQTSVYISLPFVPCTIDPSGLDSLLAFHHSCVQLLTQLRLYFSSVSAFVHI